MRRIVNVVAVVVALVALASASHAASPTASCDKQKSSAAGSLFADVMKCNTKGFADPSFDLGTCRTRAYEKCVARFGIADAKFGGACVFTGNGASSCQETLNSANTIYGGV